MVSDILTPQVTPWSELTHYWYQWLLFSIIVAAAGIGVVYIISTVVVRSVKYYRFRPREEGVSKQAVAYLDALTPQLAQRPRLTITKPASFSIYLGDFQCPPRPAQLDILRRSDLVILDPAASYTRHVVNEFGKSQYLGRVDLESLNHGVDQAQVRFERFCAFVLANFTDTSFRGVLVAGLEDTFSPAYTQLVLTFLYLAGLSAYVEVKAPTFLRDTNLVSHKAVSGLVVRNAVIMPDGQHRDYFDMAAMQPTLRAFVRESCLRSFTILALEFHDDKAVVSNAVLKRGIQWCKFYSTLTWAGPETALTDPTINHALVEPMGAFEWLKDENVMKIHAKWRRNTVLASSRTEAFAEAWQQIAQFVPEATKLVASQEEVRKGSITSQTSTQTTTLPSPPVLGADHPALPEAFEEYQGLGCYPLGVDVSPLAFAEVTQAQLRFRNMKLLHPVDKQKLTAIGVLYNKFLEQYLMVAYPTSCDIHAAVKSLSKLAQSAKMGVYLGLSPGFRYGSQARFWGVYQAENDGIDMYVSKDAQGIAGTILHTFLSCKGFAREKCFEIETVLAIWSNDAVETCNLPRRVVQDVDLLTPQERLILLQQLKIAGSESGIIARIQSLVRESLVEGPSHSQLSEIDSVGYLNKSVTIRALLEARFAWYDELRVTRPSIDVAQTFFEGLERSMITHLGQRQDAKLSAFSRVLEALLDGPPINAWTDILGLATFCAARKAALDEVYIEVTDRNPLLNDQPDQAAAFAESFALGSRCEAYFDVSPSVFGKLLSDRFRDCYDFKQPPSWTNGAPDFATAYGGAQIDVDPHGKSKSLPQFQRFTFLSVFAVPALVDIALLTTVGRGLYLSAFMSFDHQNSATTALMISLLLSGATGTWIACGGSYYLISMAFSAMNAFVLTRLIAVLALAIAGGIVGFAVTTGVKNVTSGVVFFLYFVAFTLYLTLFAALASFQFPGSSFLSGRKLVMMCLPWLLISPVITVWTHHDVVVYLVVFYAVIGLLVLSLRYIGSRWVTWYQDIKKTDDSEIRKWYTMNKAQGRTEVLGAITDPAALKLSREALLADVIAETRRGLFRRQTKDDLVRGLAADWEATNFLLDWYCRYSDVPRPIPFSSSWNIQTKVALQTLVDAQKGIRLHSAFIHWRQSGGEVGCGILYFMIALLDKWVEMLSGVHLLGLSASVNNQFRVAVGFGLAYYLIGAVLIDIRAQDLHDAVAKAKPVGVETTAELRQHQKEEVMARRSVYKQTLVRYLLWHCWSLSLSAVFVLMLSNSLDGVVLFLAYVGAYTGLLWYQYTKIFCGPHALKPLLTAVTFGLIVGLVLKKTLPGFAYTGVIALATATWTAAVLCLFTAKLGMPKHLEAIVDKKESFHAHTRPWADPSWSQAELKVFFEKANSLSSDARFVVAPSEHPGTEVISILYAYHAKGGVGQAFPDASDLIDIAAKAWESGQIQIELVALSKMEPDIFAISRWTNCSMKVFVGIGSGPQSLVDIRSNCRVIAELLLHEVAEGYFNVPHEHAALAEHLVSETLPQNLRMMLATEPEHEKVLSWGRREMLKQQCLGIDCDLYWDRLPKSTRKIFLQRSLGHGCELDSVDFGWLSGALALSTVEDLTTYVARCDFALEVVASTMDHAFVEEADPVRSSGDCADDEISPDTVLRHAKTLCGSLFHSGAIFIKFLVVAMVADLEFQRELEFVLDGHPWVFCVPCRLALNGVWSYAKWVQDKCLAFFVFYGRKNVQRLWSESRGTTVTQQQDKWIIASIDGDSTAFRENDPLGGFTLKHYTGIHSKEPKQDTHLLQFLCTYSTTGELLSKEEYSKGEILNAYEYDYEKQNSANGFFRSPSHRIPEQRRCIRGPRFLESIDYGRGGLVLSGSYMVDGNLVYFKLDYCKNAQHPSELLRGEFTLAHINCTIEWCAPPRRNPEKLNRWIPHSKVLAATFVSGSNVYVSRWSYDHKFHPTITTTLNNEAIATPPMIEHDWLGVLKKPYFASFLEENPLYHFTFWNSNAVARWLGCSTKRTRVSTGVARTRIWKAWKASKDLDGVIVRFLDEQLLRGDPVLQTYWRYRGRGDLKKARAYFHARADAIMASADLDEEIASWTPLAFKMTDFVSFGSGGDAILHTKSQKVGIDDCETLHVLAVDNGTWPNEGGGVSACRRDMINSLKSVRWHMLCESANDFGLPKHQTEQNVLSLKVIPLWGLDFLTPTHGLFKNRLDAEVDAVRTEATDMDIRREFVPILTALVKGARTIRLSSADIRQATRALVKLNEYFSDKRHWSQVWTSDISKDAWRQLWLSQDLPNTKPSAEWLDTELPTLGHLDTAMELWLRYLFVFAIRVPEKLPAVFQASHHSVSAAYGIVCKIKRQCQLQIWDHAIAWRETNMCLSSTLCKLPPFVRNSMLGLMRLTSVLILHHADVILPCADFFNPGWEVEIGTCEGTIEHRNSFKRKIAPVVNGITDADKFKPVEKILTKQPTVTMLSHLWFCKDLKTAILAADIIVNEWGFKDYQLDVYGSIEKAPIYSNECQELIASKALRGQVKLCGTADPLKVLEQTWLFLNSSLSEGLPLALGEAALTGAPVVCTDVGASLRVLSDPDDFSRYSAVVAPNDARALARAQIKMLAMLDEFGQYAAADGDGDHGPSPVMPFAPTPQDVEWITVRMYAKSEHRRKLGMRSREIVQKSFGGERYLREHEQMLWIGKIHKLMQTRRVWGHLSDTRDATEMGQKVRLAELVEDDRVIPRSAAPSWRSPSPSSSSLSSRPMTPRQEARASSRRLGQYVRSTTGLSQASTAVAVTRSSSSLSLSSAGRSSSGLHKRRHDHFNHQHSFFQHHDPKVNNNDAVLLTALPGFGPDASPIGVKKPAATMHRGRTRTNSFQSSDKILEMSCPPSRTTTTTTGTGRRPELRYRNSDVSVVQLERVGRWLNPMS